MRKLNSSDYERLTEKCDDGYTFVERYTEDKIIDKLGKLEDLEEQLGCPLEVVFKALTNGIYNGVPEHIEAVGLVIVFNNFALTCFDIFGNQTGCYPTNEYKKTWWLKKDKSE